MMFATPGSREFAPRSESPLWRNVLFVAAVVGGLAATQPWVRVEFVRLFGELFGPPAWKGTAGFTLLCTCALLAVMSLIETKSREAKQAVRPASALLAVVMFVSLVLHAARGPGTLRNVTASWTVSFYFGSLAAAVVVIACIARSNGGMPQPRT
ncbi:MAG: hypothetical protein AB8H80_07520 [Planctomycetota bacterium]